MICARLLFAGWIHFAVWGCRWGILTYMSIRNIIHSHLAGASPRLVMLNPFLPFDPVVRTMVMSNEVARHVHGPWPSIDAERRCARVRADLDAFVTGAVVTICLEPFEASDERFGLLHKPSYGIFDVRCFDPRPNIRILGGFADQDLFVALTFHPRSKPISWLDRPPLGDGGSVEWASAVHDTRKEWCDLFGSEQPRTGKTPDVFLTNFKS